VVIADAAMFNITDSAICPPTHYKFSIIPTIDNCFPIQPSAIVLMEGDTVVWQAVLSSYK
jgi:hypothetical protein